MRRQLVEVRQILEVPVVLFVHHEVRLPEVLLLEHRPDRRIERDRVAAHHPDTLPDQVSRRLRGHAGEVSLVTLLGLVGTRAGVDEDDVAFLHLVTDRVKRAVDLVGKDARPLLLVPEVEHDPVREAVLERDPLDTGRLWPADVLDRVQVRAHVIVLHDHVARRQRFRTVLGRADPLREVCPALVQHQHRWWDAWEREHVGVHRHREVDKARHAGAVLSRSANSSRCRRTVAPARSGSRSRSASRM